MSRVTTREYLRANLFDGDEGGRFSFHIGRFLDELVPLVDDLLREATAGQREPLDVELLARALPVIFSTPYEYADGHKASVVRDDAAGVLAAEYARLAAANPVEPAGLDVGCRVMDASPYDKDQGALCVTHGGRLRDCEQPSPEREGGQ